ncbi:MAG: DUF948 domain-containing protein [Leptolyngbyaceae cyanobacterium SM2_5_2]|nr:DUF948 domain-containing protein [Leptolyngbyaceae cyanobacterium SM2_5_2]
MTNPLLWLALSLLLLAVSLTAVLLAAIPTLRELSRAARSAEKLFDTLGRELPPTLEAIRLTGQEVTSLTDDLSPGVQAVGRVVQQVDQSLVTAQQQAQLLNTGSRSFLAGVQAAWQAWNRSGKPAPHRKPKRLGHQRSALPNPPTAPLKPSQPVEAPAAIGEPEASSPSQRQLAKPTAHHQSSQPPETNPDPWL